MLLDIQLPDISGFEIAQHLRHKYESGVYDYLPPIIALTANVMQNKANYRKYGMDDVLRKPLELEALVNCIRHYFADEINIGLETYQTENLIPTRSKKPTTEKPQTSAQSVTTEISDAINIPMLKELLEILDIELLTKNLYLFKKTMPTYLQELDKIYAKYEQDASFAPQVASVAHKIKGAAASIGLLRIQELMQNAQQNDKPEWKTYIQLWIKELHSSWQTNVAEVEKWLEKYAS